VLNTKHVTSGRLLGLGSSSKVQLTAAVDDVPPPSGRGLGGGPAETLAARSYAAASAVVSAAPDEPTLCTRMPDAVTRPAQQVGGGPDEIADLRSELRRLSVVVQNLIARSARRGSRFR